MSVPLNHSFDDDAQLAFARLSGDFNPIHVDAVESRRLLFGRPVVHGVHTLLAAVSHVLASQRPRVALASVDARFVGALHPGDQATIHVTHEEAALRLRVAAREQLVMTCRLRLFDGSEWDHAVENTRSHEPARPLELSDAELGGCRGSVPLQLDPRGLSALFPVLGTHASNNQLAILLATTHVVGMKCPGRHSVFTRLSLDFERPTFIPRSATLEFSGTMHPTFRVIDLTVRGAGAAGKLGCAVRGAPVEQRSFEALRASVLGWSSAFAGTSCLVVGGSRGLGEVTAKLLAASGAEVVLTYRGGREDAERVRSEITGGGGKASLLQLDVEEDQSVAAALSTAPRELSHLYYFASPPILRAREASPSRLDRYRQVYVKGLERLVLALRPRGLRYVMSPSTSFIDEAPAGFADYVAAKKDAEALCAALSTSGLDVAAPRLPMVLTDQTGGFNAQELASAESVLIPLLFP